MNFRAWLDKQQSRKDRIGKLARFMADKEMKFRSSRRRKRDEHSEWASTVTYHGGAEAAYIFNDAWKEYKEATPEPAEK